MHDPLDLSDAEFMEWAGAEPGRWALLPSRKREAWLEHLLARVGLATDEDERNRCRRLAYVIVRVEAAP